MATLTRHGNRARMLARALRLRLTRRTFSTTSAAVASSEDTGLYGFRVLSCFPHFEDSAVHGGVKSKSNPKSNRNQNAEPNSFNNNISNSIASCSDTNHASCSTPAPNNPQTVLKVEKVVPISLKQILKGGRLVRVRLKYLLREERLVRMRLKLFRKVERLVRAGFKQKILRRETGTSGLEINTTKKGKTGTNEPHLTGASSYPQIQKNMPKKGEKSAKRKRRLVVSSAPAKRQKAVEWPKDFVEKQREYFAEVDAEELLLYDIS